MKCPPVFANEQERLQALSEYGLSNDRPLPSLDQVVQLATHVFGMPMAAVNIVGSEHMFFAASAGLQGPGLDLSRNASFCAHAMAQDQVMVVEDATQDDRFHDNPLVTGPAHLRFYAGVPLRSSEGHPLGALCVLDSRAHHDFTDEDRGRLRDLAQMAADRLELRRVELSTEQARRPFDEFAMHSPTAVVRLDESGQIVTWNQAAASLFGYELSDGARLQMDLLVPQQDRLAIQALIAQTVRQGSTEGVFMPTNLRGRRRDGSEFLLGLSVFCWRDKGHWTLNAHLQDLTEHHRQSEERHRLAETDALTGLANRAHLYRCLEQILSQGRAAAVLILDIDGFKDVNDTLGPALGDAVLRDIGRRLLQCSPPAATAARLGGDEFAILMPDEGQLAPAWALAQTALARIRAPLSVDGQAVRVDASCGVALAPLHAMEAVELICDADLALFRAKVLGRGQAFAYVPALRTEAAARRLYSIELHRAVSDGEFVLFYQPQIRLSDGQLTGAEALIRWQHPQRGLLSPAAFLPALETGPLAAVVGFWVLDEACAQAARWRSQGANEFRIGVNLFAAQFHVDDLVAQVTSALARHGLPAHALELEITENIALDQDGRVLSSLERLRALGVGIAFDDFGTGYASLSLLKSYPLSRLKIDRSFVQSMTESARDDSVVRALLDIARSFGLQTIAEGIEGADQHARLQQFGCEEGQGYLFGRPVSAAEFEERFGLAGLMAVAMK